MDTQTEKVSSSDRRRQLEESVASAMVRYRSDYEAVRVNTARLREQREAREAEVTIVTPKKKR